MSKTLTFVGAVPAAVEQLRGALEQVVQIPAFGATGDAVNEVVVQRVGEAGRRIAELVIIPTAAIAKNGTNFVTAALVNVTPSSPVTLATLSSEGSSGNMAAQYTPTDIPLAAAAPPSAGDVLVFRLTQTTGAGKATPAMTLIIRWAMGGE